MILEDSFQSSLLDRSSPLRPLSFPFHLPTWGERAPIVAFLNGKAVEFHRVELLSSLGALIDARFTVTKDAFV